MSVPKHYTEWPKEEKEALARQRMEAMMKKNEEIKRRYAEVEADRKKAEQQNSSVTLVIRNKSPSRDDLSRNRGGEFDTDQEDPKRNSNYWSRNFRSTRPGMAPGRPHDKEFSKESNMSVKERDDYEKWRAERKKIDEERIARHKVKREWDEDKLEQEPQEQKPMHSKFYREPNWTSKQDDRPQRRDFNQKGYFHGNERTHFKNSRQNDENEDLGWHDKSSKFGKSRNNEFSLADRQNKSPWSDEDKPSYGRQHKFDRPNNYSGFRKNQDSSNSSSSRFRGRGGGFYHGSQNENKSNTNQHSNQNNSFSKSSNSAGFNPSFTASASNNWSDTKNDNQDAGKNRYQGKDSSHIKPRVKNDLGTWADDDNTANTITSFTKSEESSGTWSEEDSPASHNTSEPKQSSGTWSDADDASSNVKTRETSQKDNSVSKHVDAAWPEGNGNIKSSSKSLQKNSASIPQAKQNPYNWCDGGGDHINATAQMKSYTAGSKSRTTSGTWSDEDETAGKSKNDNAWLESNDRNESFCSEFAEKQRKWHDGKQPSRSFPGGRGRKWSFESAPQRSSNARNVSFNHDTRNERAIKFGKDDSLRVTLQNLSSDVKGSEFLAQKSERNEAFYENKERKWRVLSRSLSDADKYEIKHQKQSDDDIHEHQQNARLLRSTSSSIRKGRFGRNTFDKTHRGEFSSRTEERGRNKFQDSSWNGNRGGRGRFQHGQNRGARAEENRRSWENREVQSRSNTSWENEEQPAATKNPVKIIPTEDIWGDTENLENTDFDHKWMTDDKGYSTKSKDQVSDGWVTQESSNSCLHSSKKQVCGDGWESENTEHNQVSAEGKQHENIKSSDKSTDVHKTNAESVCDESRDDGSWVTTSSDEYEDELGEGEYIDDDESLHVSSMQCYDGPDTSSPEPNIPDFVCSMKTFLSSKAANEHNNDLKKDEAENEDHEIPQTKNFATGALCTVVYEVENSKKTEGHTSDMSKFKCSDLLENKSSEEISVPLQSDSIDTPKNDLDSCTMHSGAEKHEDTDNECSDAKVLETKNSENVQMSDINSNETVCEEQVCSELFTSNGEQEPILSFKSCEETNLSYVESCCKDTIISTGQLESNSISTSNELLHSPDSDNSSHLQPSAEDTHLSCCASDGSSCVVETCIRKTDSDPLFTNTSDVNKNSSLQDICAFQNPDDQEEVHVASGNMLSSTDANHIPPDMSSKEDASIE